MSTRSLAFVLFAVMIACSAAHVAAEESTLEFEVAQSTVRVGDRVEVLASARGGESGWLWGELTVALEPGGAWELIDGPTAVAGVRPPAWQLTLVPMELGDQPLPRITVSIRSPDGETVAVGADDSLMVSVVSILGGDEEEPAPAPLRDPIGARGFPWEWVLPIAGVLLPLFAGIAWMWRGRGRSQAIGRAFLPPLTEFEAMVSELEERVGREPADGICDRMAAGLRHYLERRTGEPAEEMTSFELRLLARDRGWPEATQRLVQRVMGVADGIRFGRRPSTEDELRNAISHALEAARLVESFFAETDGEPAVEQVGS